MKKQKIKNYLIISTYPEQGSKNIGDLLITQSVIKALNKTQKNISIEIIWREKKDKKALKKIKNADVIIFACFAIRKNILKFYPTLKYILKKNKKLAVVSAGTSLDIFKKESMLSGYSEKDIDLIKELDRQSIFFTTRGYLSQYFCEKLGLKKAHFSGDIAFLKNFSKKIDISSKVKKIAISDPHSQQRYIKALDLLISNLKSLFPKSEVEVLFHGENEMIKKFLEYRNISYSLLYNNKEGLREYKKYDLHVGYRVHGHVTALSFGKPSYLLEQDGRGIDYGLTINKKISVPTPVKKKFNTIITLILRLFYILFPKFFKKKIIFLSYIFCEEYRDQISQIIPLLKQDTKNSFKKFKDINEQIKQFNEDNLRYFEMIS